MFQLCKDGKSTKLGLMCLAQVHNTVTPVRLEPAAPRSRVKHSTTELLRSLTFQYTDHFNNSNPERLLIPAEIELSFVNPLLHNNAFWRL